MIVRDQALKSHHLELGEAGLLPCLVCPETGPICKSYFPSPIIVLPGLILGYRYISYRQSYAHHPTQTRKNIRPSANGFSTSGYESEERRGLMSAGAFEDDGDAVIEMDLLPPRWIDIQDEVTELLGTIAKKSADLEKLHQKHVLPGFDDEDVKRKEEITIERMTQEITRGFHDCQKAIQRIEMLVRDARHQGGVSAADETMARNIQISLASRVQEVSAGFRKKQSNYLKSERIELILRLYG